MERLNTDPHQDLWDFWQSEDHSEYMKPESLYQYRLDYTFLGIYKSIESIEREVGEIIDLMPFTAVARLISLIPRIEKLLDSARGISNSIPDSFCQEHRYFWHSIVRDVDECIRYLNETKQDRGFYDVESHHLPIDEIVKTESNSFFKLEWEILNGRREEFYFENLCIEHIGNLDQEGIDSIKQFESDVCGFFEKNARAVLDILIVQFVRIGYLALNWSLKNNDDVVTKLPAEVNKDILKKFSNDYWEYNGNKDQGADLLADYENNLKYRVRNMSDSEAHDYYKSTLQQQEAKLERLMVIMDGKYNGDQDEVVLRIWNYFNGVPYSREFGKEIREECSLFLQPFHVVLVMYYGIRQHIEVLQKCISEVAPKLSSIRKSKVKRTFADYILDKDSKESLLQNFHILIDGRMGKGVAIVIEAAVKNSLISKPPFSVLETEFPNIGSKSAFNNYFEKDKFTDEELARYYKILKA